ncbi:molybdenum cofactor guanylyltransferase /molybdopterin guanine dinucleotide biosynthesis accessory protein MobB [Candidatus Fervidibacteria bacterium JGI MDM2 JNZ-1-D12]
MPPVRDLTVILLAGGRSKRMGEDKALMQWQGKPLLQVLVERFWAAGFSVLVSGGSADWSKRLTNMPVPVIPDLPAHENFGPLAGIEAGILNTRTKLVGVVACDLPFADPKLLSWLSEKIGDADAAIPTFDGEPQPLHAVYARTCLPKLSEQLESDDKSVKEFLKRLKVLYFPEGEWMHVADAKCLTVHLNEPADLAKASEITGEAQLMSVPVLAFVGFSGSGKTKVIEGLTKILTEKGYKVGVIKHHGHIDEEGKDTWRFQQVGAEIVGLVAESGMAIFLPERNLTAKSAIERLLRQRSVDLVLVEGFKSSELPKLVVLHPEGSEAETKRELDELLAQIPDKNTISGVISPVKLTTDLPQFHHSEIDKICLFVERDFLGADRQRSEMNPLTPF